MKRIPRFRIASGMHARPAIAVSALLYAATGGFSPASAQTIGSSYTSTAPKDCRVSSAGNGVDDSAIQVCPGKAGLVVLVSEDDLRETVSVGRDRATAAREPAAEAWFGPFNSNWIPVRVKKTLQTKN